MWLQGRNSLYYRFHFEKFSWFEGEAGPAAVTANFTRKDGVKCQIGIRESLLSLRAEYIVLQFALQKLNVRIHKAVIFHVGWFCNEFGVRYLD
jgi:hypothetical protein